MEPEPRPKQLLDRRRDTTRLKHAYRTEETFLIDIRSWGELLDRSGGTNISKLYNAWNLDGGDYPTFYYCINSPLHANRIKSIGWVREISIGRGQRGRYAATK